jgi:hypothetical protein
MAPESLRSIYQQYKRDTEVVASWLANTAREHGYDNPLGSAPASNTPNGTKAKYVLAIRDFAPLAEHIAAVKDAKIALPVWFEIALERVIWVRSAFAEKLTQAGGYVSQQSNQRHG